MNFDFVPSAFSMEKRYQGFLETHDLLNSSPLSNVSLFRMGTYGFKTSSGVPPVVSGKLRFGHQMERFFSYWLSANPRFEILAENLQIIRDGITLGEFDFIVRDNVEGRILHIELAFKFYLGIRNNGDYRNYLSWVGPNRNDTLALKLQKLGEKQFFLLKSNAAKEQLARMGIEADTVRQALCLKGQLYTPTGWNPKEEDVNLGAVHGRWIPFKDFEPERFENALFLLPEKMDWIAKPDNRSEWIDYRTAYPFIETEIRKKRAVHCLEKSAAGEVRRFFLVWW